MILPEQREGEGMKFVRELSETEKEELKAALHGWSDAAEVRRVRAVHLSAKGWTVLVIAEALDATRWSVRRWIGLYEAQGLEGLRTSSRPGRPSKVDEQYMELLKRTVEIPPRKLGLPFNSWTLPHLGIYMDKKTGVTVSSGHMSRLLKRLGYVYKRPRHDLSHRRDDKLYAAKKAELEELKKGLSSRRPDSNLSSWTSRRCT